MNIMLVSVAGARIGIRLAISAKGRRVLAVPARGGGALDLRAVLIGVVSV